MEFEHKTDNCQLGAEMTIITYISQQEDQDKKLWRYKKKTLTKNSSNHLTHLIFGPNIYFFQKALRKNWHGLT